LCANLAFEQPLALIVDDAHNADCASLRFALYLAQRFDELPICLVLAGNPRSSKRSAEPFDELLACPVTRTLELNPLSPGGVATLLRRSLFPDASDGFCLACFGATGGNPFLLRELAVDLAADGEHRDGDAANVLDAGPDSVARSVLLRLHAIGPGATELAQAVAVLGYGAELQHAARIAELEPSDAARIADEMMVPMCSCELGCSPSCTRLCGGPSRRRCRPRSAPLSISLLLRCLPTMGLRSHLWQHTCSKRAALVATG
jgi:hypothetical protein